MSEASVAAEKLAVENGIDLSEIEGTGADGLIKKSDVEQALESQPHTNIMDALQGTRAANDEAVSVSIPVESSEIALPSQEEMYSIMQSMKGELAELRAASEARNEVVNRGRDLTDDMIFIARPDGQKWEEARVVDGKQRLIEFSATEFLGPFADEEAVDAYLAIKRSRRTDSAMAWQNVYTIVGHEARKLRDAEKQEREKQFAGSSKMNILDQRIFAQANAGHTPGLGTIVGPAA